MPEATFYHGTRAGFRGPGGLLLPRTDTGAKATTAPVNPGREAAPDADKYVYLTLNEEVAWAYAWAAPGRGAPKVLVVRPGPGLEPDFEHSSAMQAYRCEYATVLRVNKTPLITEDEARAGWATSPA